MTEKGIVEVFETAALELEGYFIGAFYEYI
jgi:hypothetical protein